MVSTFVKSGSARGGRDERLQCLRRRFESGAAVTLDDAFQAARLSGREVAVLQERLAGRSFAAIATGCGLTRQAVQQAERAALARRGVRGSLAVFIYDDEQGERAAVLRERGRRVKEAELRHVRN
jgi:hypothetical protein